MKRPLPPTVFLGAIILAVALHFLLPLRQVLKHAWRLAGILPIVMGIILNLAADRAFKEKQTTVKPFEESNALVTRGVFGITRNPMYLGMSLVMFGIAILLGSVIPFAIAAALPLMFDRMFISLEEETLEKTFGDRFTNYRKQVRRWL